jgi:DNA-binding GntR family transcriptional regulator
MSETEFSKQTITDRIFEILKKRILDGTYPPGYRLKETELPNEFKVSHIPIREVLKLLKSEGYVKIVPYKGAEVVDFNNQAYAENNYEIRIMIETFAIEKIINNDDIYKRFIVEFAKALKKIKLSDKSATELVMHELEFHNTIVKTAENQQLTDIYEKIQFSSPRYLPSNRNDENYDYESNYQRHENIYNAVLSRDIEKVKKAIVEHFS